MGYKSTYRLYHCIYIDLSLSLRHLELANTLYLAIYLSFYIYIHTYIHRALLVTASAYLPISFDLCAYLFIYRFTCLPICLSPYLSMCLSTYLIYLSITPCLYALLSICTAMYPSTNLPSVRSYQPTYLRVYLPIHLSSLRVPDVPDLYLSNYSYIYVYSLYPISLLSLDL